MPWIDHEDYPAPDFSVAAFRQYYADLQEAACLFGGREADAAPQTTSKKRRRDDVAAATRDRDEARRTIAAGRLYSIDTMVGAFQTPSALLQDLNRNHRGAHRTLWCDVDGPPTSGFEAREFVVKGREAASHMKKLLAHAEQLRNAPSLMTRLARAQKNDEETTKDLDCLVTGSKSQFTVGRRTFADADAFATQEARDAYVAQHRLAVAARERSTFEKHLYTSDAATSVKNLRKPLAAKEALRDDDDAAAAPAPAGSGTDTALPTLATTQIPAEYMDVAEDTWRAQSAAWKATAPEDRGPVPYNPQQRKALRRFYTAMKFTADAKRAGMSLEEVTDAFDAEDRAARAEDRDVVAAQINLVVGPGGTGKSAIVFDARSAASSSCASATSS